MHHTLPKPYARQVHTPTLATPPLESGSEPSTQIASSCVCEANPGAHSSQFLSLVGPPPSLVRQLALSEISLPVPTRSELAWLRRDVAHQPPCCRQRFRRPILIATNFLCLIMVTSDQFP